MEENVNAPFVVFKQADYAVNIDVPKKAPPVKKSKYSLLRERVKAIKNGAAYITCSASLNLKIVYAGICYFYGSSAAENMVYRRGRNLPSDLNLLPTLKRKDKPIASFGMRIGRVENISLCHFNEKNDKEKEIQYKEAKMQAILELQGLTLNFTFQHPGSFPADTILASVRLPIVAIDNGLITGRYSFSRASMDSSVVVATIDQIIIYSPTPKKKLSAIRSLYRSVSQHFEASIKSVPILHESLKDYHIPVHDSISTRAFSKEFNQSIVTLKASNFLSSLAANAHAVSDAMSRKAELKIEFNPKVHLKSVKNSNIGLCSTGRPFVNEVFSTDQVHALVPALANSFFAVPATRDSFIESMNAILTLVSPRVYTYGVRCIIDSVNETKIANPIDFGDLVVAVSYNPNKNTVIAYVARDGRQRVGTVLHSCQIYTNRHPHVLGGDLREDLGNANICLGSYDKILYRYYQLNEIEKMGNLLVDIVSNINTKSLTTGMDVLIHGIKNPSKRIESTIAILSTLTRDSSLAKRTSLLDGFVSVKSSPDCVPLIKKVFLGLPHEEKKEFIEKLNQQKDLPSYDISLLIAHYSWQWAIENIGVEKGTEGLKTIQQNIAKGENDMEIKELANKAVLELWKS